MSTKAHRLQKIKECMRMRGDDLTITEIYESIVKSYHIDVSRKTIQRDMEELIEKKIVRQKEGSPLKFTLIQNKSYNIKLTINEIDEILEILFSKPLIRERILCQIYKDDSYND